MIVTTKIKLTTMSQLKFITYLLTKYQINTPPLPFPLPPLSFQVFGYHHPRTQRCRNCLSEATYVAIKRKRDMVARNNDLNSNMEVERREAIEDYMSGDSDED